MRAVLNRKMLGRLEYYFTIKPFFMPTKIVAGESNPAEGLIKKEDLDQIIQDFDNLVNINSRTSRIFTKVSTISIPLSMVKQLIEGQPDSETMKMKIKFGITLPNAKDCKDG